MPSVDVHQHLWPEGVLAVLERRSEAPRARWAGGRWRVELDGEPFFEIDPADHEPEDRAKTMGVDRALVALSSPVGAESSVLALPWPQFPTGCDTPGSRRP